MDINQKFKNLPADPDTTILAENVVEIADTTTLHQTWLWDGINAQSLIFAKKDVEHLDDEQLKTLVSRSMMIAIDNSDTYNRGIYLNLTGLWS